MSNPLTDTVCVEGFMIEVLDPVRTSHRFLTRSSLEWEDRWWVVLSQLLGSKGNKVKKTKNRKQWDWLELHKLWHYTSSDTLWIVSMIFFLSFFTLSGGVSFRHSSTYLRNPAWGDAVWLWQNVLMKSSNSLEVEGGRRLARLRPDTLLSVREEDVEGEEEGEERWESGGVGEGGASRLRDVMFSLATVWVAPW